MLVIRADRTNVVGEESAPLVFEMFTAGTTNFSEFLLVSDRTNVAGEGSATLVFDIFTAVRRS